MSETLDVTLAIAELKAKQAELFTQAEEERKDLVARLSTLCHLLGPITRADLPDGILRRRARKAAPAAKAGRKKRAAAPAAEPGS